MSYYYQCHCAVFVEIILHFSIAFWRIYLKNKHVKVFALYVDQFIIFFLYKSIKKWPQPCLNDNVYTK